MISLLLQAENEIKLRNLSFQTRKHYLRCLKEFLVFLETKRPKADPRVLNRETIKNFLFQKLEHGASGNTINLYLNAITFFYHQVVKNPEKIGLKFAKRPRRLPVVLTREEIHRIIEVLQNKKHKLMIALAYSAGLRVNEVVRLRAGDVHLENLMLHIRNSKGGRDRITIFSEKLRGDITEFIKRKSGNQYLFESERGGGLTKRTAQKVFERAIQKAGILKPATFHSLRHSFATHLIENNVNLRYVQELLGHQNIRTTERYTQVTSSALRNVKSPL